MFPIYHQLLRALPKQNTFFTSAAPVRSAIPLTPFQALPSSSLLIHQRSISHYSTTSSNNTPPPPPKFSKTVLFGLGTFSLLSAAFIYSERNKTLETTVEDRKIPIVEDRKIPMVPPRINIDSAFPELGMGRLIQKAKETPTAKATPLTYEGINRLLIKKGSEEFFYLCENNQKSTEAALLEFFRRSIHGRSIGVRSCCEDEESVKEMNILLQKVDGSIIHSLIKTLLKDYNPTNYIRSLFEVILGFSSYEDTFKEIINHCFNEINLNICPTSTQLAELLTIDSSHSSSKLFIDAYGRNVIFNYVIRCLIEIPYEKWPLKEKVLLALFELSSNDKKISISLAQQLKFASDQKTQLIGYCFYQAFNNSTTNHVLNSYQRRVYPWLYYIQELVPSTYIPTIFGLNLPRFTFKTENQSTLKCFTMSGNAGNDGIFKPYENFIIRQYTNNTIYAFDKYEQNVNWSYSINKEIKFWTLSSEGLFILDDHSLRLINLKNGEMLRESQLPATLLSGTKPHITPSGFCYFLSENKIYGGKCDSAGKWETRFTIDKNPKSLSAQDEFIHLVLKDGTCCVVDQEGKMVKFPNCMDLLIQNGKLFTIERGFDHNKLIVQSINENKKGVFTLSDSREELKINRATMLRGVCDDDTVIATSATKIIFANINKKKKKVLDFDIPRDCNWLVNQSEGSIYFRGINSGKLCKFTKKGMEELGHIHGYYQQFIIDDEGHIYFG